MCNYLKIMIVNILLFVYWSYITIDVNKELRNHYLGIFLKKRQMVEWDRIMPKIYTKSLNISIKAKTRY